MHINLRKSLFILPNLFTLSSIFCGFYAIVLSTQNASPDDLYRASLLIIFAMFFDLIDGRVARLTRTQSDFGVELDSLYVDTAIMRWERLTQQQARLSSGQSFADVKTERSAN